MTKKKTKKKRTKLDFFNDAKLQGQKQAKNSETLLVALAMINLRKS